MFFDLGLNIGRLLSLPAGAGLLGRATLQMLAEYGHHTDGDGALADLVSLRGAPGSGVSSHLLLRCCCPGC